MSLIKRFNSLLTLLLLAVGCYGLLVFCCSGIQKIHFPYMTNLGEPAVSQAIRFIAEGKNPYHDLRFPPYVLVPYGPVYLFAAAVLRIFFTAPFVSGRAVGLASSLLCTFFIYRILRAQKVRRTLALSAATLFLACPYVVRWGVQVNVDMTGVMFSAFTFYCMLRFCQGGFVINRFFWSACAAGAAAFFTKSSMLTVSATFFIFLLTERRFKQALIFAAAGGLAVLLIYGALMIWTDGQYFFHTAYEISKRRFFAKFIGDNWRAACVEVPALVLVTLFVFYEMIRKRRTGLFSLYLFFSVLITLSLGKQGSDTNYFLEWCMTSSVALGLVLERCSISEDVPQIGTNDRRIWLRTMAAALVFIQAFVWTRPTPNVFAQSDPYKAQREFYDRLSVFVTKMPGKVLSEDMGLLVANGREIYYEPFPMGQMSYSGIWDQGLIVKDLDDRVFSLAILYSFAPRLIRNRVFTERFMAMFKRRYIFIGGIFLPGQKPGPDAAALFFYRPRTDSELL